MKRIHSLMFIAIFFLCIAVTFVFAEEALITNIEQPAGLEENKISLDLKGMDVVEVVKMLATKGNLNVVISSDVKGRVTIFLKSVDIMDAFEIILIANNLAYDKRGDIIYVMSQRDYEAIYGERYAEKKAAKIFQLKYAKASEVSKALNQIKTRIGKVIVDEGSNTIVAIDNPGALEQITDTVDKLDVRTVTKIFELKYAKAADLKTKISEVLTKGVGAVQMDERTNKIIVMDLEKRMPEISQMVKAFDDKLQQVLIEAKIIQITLDDKYKLGVDWEQVLHKLEKEISIKSTFELAAKNAFTPGAQVVIGTLGSATDYAAMVQALKTIGDTNLLSSPRITALNNQEAKILVGTSQPYASNTVTQGTSTTTTATSLNFIDVGVKLYVTPTINKDNFVTMKIKPEVSSVSGTYTYGSPSTTVPIVSTTQAETSVTVKDGITIIIAGLIKDERTSTVDKVPILGDIPIIGHAFRKTDKEIKKQELVVFLTPHVVSGESDYLEQPQTAPIGERQFTVPETLVFERRKREDMKPGYFKQKRRKMFEKAPKEEEIQKKGALVKTVIPATPAEYYYVIKERIVENIEFPKGAKAAPLKGEVRIAFSLSRSGELVDSPEILGSSNNDLDLPSINAVKKASPFPEFPESIGQDEKRFIVNLIFE
ncbi:MAG: hypothetical protein A2987_02260 [Omnitrophica bacterium RIFCSPLOWO2_01_FULL_45_10]|nr:MAG: hypothetical protein A2987_02260 [Omnitrophica bacterium RIFCSPLOWO2_01_FULL_45_10]